MTTLRQLGYGAALLCALALLFWGQYQQGQAVAARETLASERQQQAKQRIERQATTITTLNKTLQDERQAQTGLRTTQNQLRLGLAKREQQIEELKRENSDLRQWAAQPGLHRRTYRDGAVIEYDSINHHLRAILPAAGTTELESLGGISIKGPITHQGDYTQTGNQTVTGKVTVSQDVIAAGISLVNHTHGGVQAGPSSTGKPQ